MRESPILFGAPMVRAILDGRKTVTRRIVKPQPKLMTSNWYCDAGGSGKWMADGPSPPTGGTRQTYPWSHCPYGQLGDRLWVRESGIIWKEAGLFRHDVPATPGIGRYWVERTRAPGASYNVHGCTRAAALAECRAKACPSIHMPRWASRITLEVTGVRVERLRDISEADALAEGIDAEMCRESLGGAPLKEGYLPICAFSYLWDKINGIGNWDANPWVWAVSFRRIEQEARAA